MYSSFTFDVQSTETNRRDKQDVFPCVSKISAFFATNSLSFVWVKFYFYSKLWFVYAVVQYSLEDPRQEKSLLYQEYLIYISENRCYQWYFELMSEYNSNWGQEEEYYIWEEGGKEMILIKGLTKRYMQKNLEVSLIRISRESPE